MHKLLTLLAALAFAVTAATGAHAVSVAQTLTMTNTFAFQGEFKVAGEISLAQGTNSVSAMNGTMSIQDQGWGLYDPFGNMVRVGLFDGATNIWSDRIGGGRRAPDSLTQSYDLLANPAQFDALNIALAGITWSGSSDVRLKVYTAGTASPGWSLTVNSGTLNVTSAALAPVPLSASALLLLAGLGILGAARRRA